MHSFERSDCQWELDLKCVKKLQTKQTSPIYAQTRTHIHSYYSFNAIPYLYGIVILKWSSKLGLDIYISFTLAMLQEHCSTCSRFLLKLRAGIDGLLRGLEVALFTSDAARIIARIRMHTQFMLAIHENGDRSGEIVCCSFVPPPE
ncbi:hypothetical protein GQX74_003434 [Glossina fuscipes]|nr:hypothetical protein GQX74_003434 [Glossina fuscipes]